MGELFRSFSAGWDLTMRCSGQRLSSRRLQILQAVSTGFGQQAARRLRAAADRGR